MTQFNQQDTKKYDRDTLNFSNSSIMLESSALQLKEQLVRYKERINESFAILGGDNKTIISQISGHNNSGLLMGINSTKGHPLFILVTFLHPLVCFEHPLSAW